MTENNIIKKINEIKVLRDKLVLFLGYLELARADTQMALDLDKKNKKYKRQLIEHIKAMDDLRSKIHNLKRPEDK